MNATNDATDSLVKEDAIKSVLAQFFEQNGWETEVHKDREHGVDFQAQKDDLCWKIEVKSEYEKNEVNYNSFLYVLGQIIMRMDSPNTYYGIAFPKTEQYEKLCAKIPQEAKERIRIFIFIIDIDTPNTIEIIPWCKVPSPLKTFGVNKVTHNNE